MTDSSKSIPRLQFRGPGGEETLFLRKDTFTIGRLGKNDLKINSAYVSRFHAEIVKEGENYRISDCQSKTGTFVNGHRVQSHQLKHGDQIKIGASADHEIYFLYGEEDLPSKSSSQLLEVTTTFLSKDRDLQNVSRFLEGVRQFSSGLPVEQVLDVVLDMAIGICGADRAFLVLLDSDRRPSFRNGRNKNKESLKAEEFQVSTTILQDVLVKGKTVAMASETEPGVLDAMKSAAEMGLQTVVCVPLHTTDPATGKQEIIGALYMDSKSITQGLSTISEGLLQSLARDTSAVLINMRLLKEAREKETIERELRMAREIQESLLPEIHGSYGFFEACAANTASRSISGDYYDLIPLTDNRFAIVIADISGKGIPAAILTSLVQGALYAEISRNYDLASCLESINRFLVYRSKTNRFVSLFLAMLDSNGNLRYVNAGHNPPFLVRKSGDIVELAAKGMVLGVMEEVAFEEKSITLQEQDVLFLYTDGVTEARNAAEEGFGEERLCQSLWKAPRTSAAETLDSVLHDVIAYVGETPRNDDLTILVLRRT